jgi:hypothetical protein
MEMADERNAAPEVQTVFLLTTSVRPDRGHTGADCIDGRRRRTRPATVAPA